MHAIRMFTRCSDPRALAHMEAAVLERVGDCYIYAAAHIGRATGWSSGQVFEFDAISPAQATDIAEECACIGALDSVRLTIDGRGFECVGTGEPRAADSIESRYRAIDIH